MGTYWIFNTFVPILQLSILVLSVLYFLKSPWFKGFSGEMRVHISTKIHLDKAKYHVLRNVILPTADGTTQIDHIIVSSYGVFVIETKNMKGWIFGGPRQRMWTQKIFKFTKQFQNPLHQNYKHVKTLKSILALNDRQIFSVVVFVGSSTFKTDMPDNVIHAAKLIRTIKSKDQHVLFEADVQMILSKIEAERLASTKKTVNAHTDHVRQIVKQKSLRHIGSGSEMPAENPRTHDGCNQDMEPAFSDSWQDRSWRFDDMEPEFTDHIIKG